MSIFGNLEHHAFSDLVRVVNHMTGVLYLRTAFKGKSVELHIHQGELNDFFVDGFPVRDTQRLDSVISHLKTSGQGTFEFEPRQMPGAAPALHLRLNDLLLNAATYAQVAEVHLPHPETLFEPARDTVAVPKSLWATWALLQPQMTRGISARELSQQLSFKEDEVREMFFRLREASLIVPQRAVASAAHEKASAPGPVRRFLNALQRLKTTVGP